MLAAAKVDESLRDSKRSGHGVTGLLWAVYFERSFLSAVGKPMAFAFYQAWLGEFFCEHLGRQSMIRR